MRIPDPLFAVINPLMRMMLRSTLHRLAGSDSLMLLEVTGRKSGRVFSIPIRYLRVDGTIHCFTTTHTGWWHNLLDGAGVTLRIEGRDLPCRAKAIAREPDKVRSPIRHFLETFPQDAVYQEIGLNPDKSLVEGDLERALAKAVFIECQPVASG